MQPMKNTMELRRFLSKYYSIKKDYVIQDKNKFYDIITCVKNGGEELSEQELMFGKTNLEQKTPAFKNYLLLLKQKNEQILLKHSNKKTLNVLQIIENTLNLFK